MVSPMVMVVSENLEVQQAFASTLGQCGLAPIYGTSIQEATAILSRHPISLIFCSDELPGDGLQGLIRETSRLPKQAPVVVVSRFDDWERYLDSLHFGAFDCVLYPLRHAEIEWVVRNTPPSPHADFKRAKVCGQFEEHPSKSAVWDERQFDEFLCRTAEFQRKQLERCAYEIFLGHGGTHGHDVDDWLQAQRELFGFQEHEISSVSSNGSSTSSAAQMYLRLRSR